ncbi:MAG: hypothetical protein ABJE95_06300 [Byssovorax sp.]
MNWGRLLPVAILGAGLGCTDLEHFSTGQGNAYCGSVTLGGAFRTGLSPRVQMRLRLDASALDGPGSPGSISTFESAGPDVERRMITDAELRRLPAMDNDPLSRPEFGDGRIRNWIFAVAPVDPTAESLLAVLSLRDDNTVEVRLLRPGKAPRDDVTVPPGQRPIFGIFPLTRQAGTCGF